MVGKPKGIIKCAQNSFSPTMNNTHGNNNNNNNNSSKAPKLKKKVQLNRTVQFMDIDFSYDTATIDSPDLDKLNGDDDYTEDDDSETNNDQSDQDSDDGEDTNTDEDESDYVVKDDGSVDDEDGMELDEDDFGPLEYRDPSDKEFLLGFELRHFALDNDSGLDNINLRLEETTHEDTSLNDNLAFGLVNALLNSSDKADKRKGKQLIKKLKGKAPKIESRSSNKKKATASDTNKPGKSLKVGSNKLKKASNKASKKASKKAMRTKHVEQSEKLRQLIASTVNQLDMNG